MMWKLMRPRPKRVLPHRNRERTVYYFSIILTPFLTNNSFQVLNSLHIEWFTSAYARSSVHTAILTLQTHIIITVNAPSLVFSFSLK